MVTLRTNLGTVESARRERFEPAGGITATNVQKAIEQAAAADAPVGLSYLTVAAEATLTGSRQVAVSSSLTLADGGAASTLTFDIATSGVTTAKIAAAAVTYGKIQNVAASRVLGNPTGAPASPSEMTLGATLAFSGAALQTTAQTGDVTTAANSFATTIVNAAVTYAKMQNTAASRLLGNPTGAPASPAEISLGSSLAFSGTAVQRAALTGDVTASQDSNATTIAANAVTYSKLATAAQGWTNTRLAKTANYTVLNADKGNTLALGGSTLFTLTVNAASGYDSNFSIIAVNEDTGRGKAIACNGISTFILWPGQSCVVYNDNNVWKVLREKRWQPTSAPTFFVDPASGSDAATNDGLASGAAAFATTANLITVLGQQIDPAGGTINISLPNQTFTLPFVVPIDSVQPGSYVVAGAAPTTISVATAVNACIDIKKNAGNWTFSGITVNSSNAGTQGVYSTENAKVSLGANMSYGSLAGAGFHLAAVIGGRLYDNIAASAITAGAAGHVYCDDNSYVAHSGQTVTLSNTPAWTTGYAQVHGGGATLHAPNQTFAGTGATGPRGVFNLNSLTDTGGAGITYFPGNSAISIASGATYDTLQGLNLAAANAAYITGPLPVAQGGTGTTTSTGTTNNVLSGSPTITTPNIVGSSTNDAAAAGSVGEYVESVVASGAAVSLVSVTGKTITSISLTAGDWDVDGFAYFTGGATTTVNVIGAEISTTNNQVNGTTAKSHAIYGGAATMFNNGFAFVSAPLPTIRLSLSVTTTVYLAAYCQFAVSTALAYGIIRARRVR